MQDKNEMASKLTPGDWMLFKGQDEQLVWLGRAVSKEEWSNQCIWKNETGSIQYADTVQLVQKNTQSMHNGILSSKPTLLLFMLLKVQSRTQ
mmetsp:Transcript_19705/g.32342  ORF Transcript_19705/g.32342 Transcript_19705/m.32342 type:complete len:92 (-) Transcript_19705:12-287(-)